MGTPTVTRTDAQLVAAVRSGDVHAFEDLYREHVDAVRRVAYQLVGNQDAAGDVVQDTFARALQHLPELREPDRFRPWLLAIARHAGTDQLRMRRRLTSLDEDDDSVLVSSGPGPESQFELRELAAQVEGCLAGLSHRDATAVAMVAHLGFSSAQVAGALDVSPGAAKVIVHRARRRLRHALTLQLMVRQPSLACDEFRSLLEEDSLAASKHLEDCEECIDAAGAEVVPFGLAVDTPPAPSPTS